MKKPRVKKLPKRPKAKSSLAVWENYHARCAAVEHGNAAALKKYQHEKDRKEHLIGALPGKAKGIKKHHKTTY